MAGRDTVSERRRGYVAPAIARGRARLRSDAIGTLVHEAIALSLRLVEPVDVLAVARTVVARDDAPVHRMAQVHRVATATSVYLTHMRREPEWTFRASELNVGEVRLDLVFVHATTGRVEADEIKTGFVGPAAEMPWVRAQLRAQLTMGRAHFGRQFAGVRLVDLPRRVATLIERIDG